MYLLLGPGPSGAFKSNLKDSQVTSRSVTAAKGLVHITYSAASLNMFALAPFKHLVYELKGLGTVSD